VLESSALSWRELARLRADRSSGKRVG